MVRSHLTYSCQTWNINQQQQREFDQRTSTVHLLSSFGEDDCSIMRFIIRRIEETHNYCHKGRGTDPRRHATEMPETGLVEDRHRFFLSQKHCKSESPLPGCCNASWRITLAESCFPKLAETRYAPVEGEALAISWSLKQTKYFTMGCNDLLVITDHKPLTKIFENDTLDELVQ